MKGTLILSIVFQNSSGRTGAEKFNDALSWSSFAWLFLISAFVEHAVPNDVLFCPIKVPKSEKQFSM